MKGLLGAALRRHICKIGQRENLCHTEVTNETSINLWQALELGWPSVLSQIEAKNKYIFSPINIVIYFFG